LEAEIIFTRSASGAAVIESLIRSASESIVAALYRFNSPRLAAALKDAADRGASVRVCMNDNDHYEENRAARATLAGLGIPLRLSHGRDSQGSKMHHKFLVIDGRTAVTGSYNWTPESEARNYENLIVLREPRLAAAFSAEFEALWNESQTPVAVGE
jgi:phosphatidylserine/phosphatidylglycerophosphate/cardiolipin synthase-like enzyme